jgi:hypothetical protein
MSEKLEDFVASGLAVAGFDLDAAARQRIAIEFSRIAAIAAVLEQSSLGAHDEPLPVYHP